MSAPTDPRREELRRFVERTVLTAPVTDIHTHLYDPAFGPLLLWGIDELLVYHYLVAEVFRHLDLPYEAFWELPKPAQAERVWEELFQKRSPLSEAARGVLTTLHRLGLETGPEKLPEIRRWFAEQRTDAFVTRCLDLAGVRRVYMTNSPFDDEERSTWERGFTRDPRFMAALRIDPLLLSWPEASKRLHDDGYIDSSDINEKTALGAQRFLRDWATRMKARYVMVSLPPTFRYPDNGATAALLDRVVLPFCRETGLPLALMLGVQRAVNPHLRLAGDGVGRSDLEALRNLLQSNPGVRLLVTVLSRENQHELCVLARKFRTLHVFGCWWFTNIPLVIDEISRLRLELLGPSFTPQHSDARVLDQVIYKWDHSRQILANALADKYLSLADAGWWASEDQIRRDIDELFGGAFERFCGSRD